MIQELYQQCDSVLSHLGCPEGCSACCGFAPATEEEYALIQRFIARHKIIPVRHPDGETCPLFIDGRCAIYPVRPMICRLYGHTQDLNCPLGRNIQDESAVRRLMDRYDVLRTSKTRILHELCWTFAEIADLPGVTRTNRKAASDGK